MGTLPTPYVRALLLLSVLQSNCFPIRSDRCLKFGPFPMEAGEESMGKAVQTLASQASRGKTMRVALSAADATCIGSYCGFVGSAWLSWCHFSSKTIKQREISSWQDRFTCVLCAQRLACRVFRFDILPLFYLKRSTLRPTIQTRDSLLPLAFTPETWSWL